MIQEIITFILACIGSVGTICMGIYNFFARRPKLELLIHDYTSYDYQVIQFFIHLQNQSSTPLCISSVSITWDGAETECELVPKRIRNYPAYSIRTPMFPINLFAQQGTTCFLEFVCLDPFRTEPAPGKTVLFVISTNRGQIRKYVSLSNTSHYLHMK